jgi:hypothetical protein
MAMAYKVLTQRDRAIGKFDPERLEAALNQYAAEGWRFAGVATADVKGLTGTKQEAIFILERDA